MRERKQKGKPSDTRHQEKQWQGKWEGLISYAAILAAQCEGRGDVDRVDVWMDRFPRVALEDSLHPWLHPFAPMGRKQCGMKWVHRETV